MDWQVDTASERALRARHLDAPELARHDLEIALARVDEELRAVAVRSLHWATSLDYDHPGLSGAAYLAHPFRVATLYLKLEPAPLTDGLSTALVHNVREVSGLGEIELAQAVGPAVAGAVTLLTVNRARQAEQAYLDSYYGAIAAAPAWTGAVKVLDKLDNLFVLCLNPNDDVRAAYLREVTSHVLPLVRKVLPHLEPLVRLLVEENRELGHRTAEQLRKEAS